MRQSKQRRKKIGRQKSRRFYGLHEGAVDLEEKHATIPDFYSFSVTFPTFISTRVESSFDFEEHYSQIVYHFLLFFLLILMYCIIPFCSVTLAAPP